MFNAHALVVVVFGLRVFARFIKTARATIPLAGKVQRVFGNLFKFGEAEGNNNVFVVLRLGNVHHPKTFGAVLNAVANDEIGFWVEFKLLGHEAVGVFVGERFAGRVQFVE